MNVYARLDEIPSKTPQDTMHKQKPLRITKFKMLSFCKILYIVYAKHQMSAAKALVQVEFPLYALHVSEF